jgi:hypothetical protein
MTKPKPKPKPIKSWAVCGGVDFWTTWVQFPYVVAGHGNAPTPLIGEHIHSIMLSGLTAVFEIVEMDTETEEAVWHAKVKPVGYTRDLTEK